jgi:hypothetical protein
MIQSLLIANRGGIACRIVRIARGLAPVLNAPIAEPARFLPSSGFDGITAMRMIQIVMPTALALAAGAAAAAAALAPPAAKPAAAPAVVRLQPLSDADLMSSRQMGCTCSFEAKQGILMETIGTEFMVRTQAGRKVCPISDAQRQRFSDGSAPYSCGGVRMSLRRTGKTTSHIESDSATTPASLTLGSGATRRSVSGTWRCAC